MHFTYTRGLIRSSNCAGLSRVEFKDAGNTVCHPLSHFLYIEFIIRPFFYSLKSKVCAVHVYTYTTNALALVIKTLTFNCALLTVWRPGLSDYVPQLLFLVLIPSALVSALALAPASTFFVSVHYLLNQLMDFNQTCIDTFMGGGEELIRLFQGHWGTLKCPNMVSVCYLLNSRMDFDQIYKYTMLGEEQKFIRFW